ncbi:hypothetical protein AZE42_10208 [Rhizopogon vesiculosus]|uniref:Uncharacterized protein n=1 Tax=Rhizopogon vesiculosus TaxID=180088 RepID=A0A1J8QTP4_9AGAM|nr:hypothetical protein AZE42_10208 [Rhizopogon vesiculosus]
MTLYAPADIAVGRSLLYLNYAYDLQGITLVAAECTFMLRTYSIWGRSRQILIILLSSLVVRLGLSSIFSLELMVDLQAILVPAIYVLTSYNSSMIISEPPIPNITSCYNFAESRIIVVAYVLLVVGECEEILILTMYRSIKYYHRSDNPLLKILIRHNIFYLACGLVFSLSVILTMVFLPDVYGDMVSNLQVTIHALLVTRMHRELWMSDRAEQVTMDDISLATMFIAPGSQDADPSDRLLDIAPS